LIESEPEEEIDMPRIRDTRVRPAPHLARATGRIALALVLASALLAVPWLGVSYRFLSIAVSTGISAIALYGLGIIFGQAGILSIGHAALMGVGGYAAAMLAERLGLGFWLGLPIAVLASAVVAGFLGLSSLRVAGHHFIIITFAFGSLFSIALTNGGSFTGGAAGLDVEPIERVLGINFENIHNYYTLVAVFLLVSIAAAYLISISSYGRTLRSIRENEPLARAIGINTNLHKLGAFMVSGLFAGLAGVLQAYYQRHVSPSLYGAFPSVYLALMVMLGGPRTLLGPLVGAIIVYFLPEVLNLDPVDSRIAYGVGLIAVIMLLPGGVVAGVTDACVWARARLRGKSDGSPPVPGSLAAAPGREEPSHVGT
jgi:branched-chain amino acid transport system permease protein